MDYFDNYTNNNSAELVGQQGGYLTRGDVNHSSGDIDADIGHVQLHEALNITNTNSWVRFYVDMDMQAGGVRFLNDHTKLRILKVG